MKIFAVRHGQSDGNIGHIIQSRSGGKLTNLGIEQAKITAAKLQDKKFDKIYCSPLARCQETLSYIRKFHAETPVIISDMLLELDKGDLEGKNWVDLPSTFYSETHIGVQMPGGESWVDVDTRIRTFINEIYDPRSESILLVTHDGPLKVLHSILKNIPLGQAIQIPYDNAGVYELEMHDKVSSLVS